MIHQSIHSLSAERFTRRSNVSLRAVSHLNSCYSFGGKWFASRVRLALCSCAAVITDWPCSQEKVALRRFLAHRGQITGAVEERRPGRIRGSGTWINGQWEAVKIGPLKQKNFQAWVVVWERAPPQNFDSGGGGGSDSWAPKPTYPKNCFSSDFGQFIWKMLENAKHLYVLRKRYWNIQISGGHPPRFSKVRGSCPDPHDPPPVALVGTQKSLSAKDIKIRKRHSLLLNYNFA